MFPVDHIIRELESHNAEYRSEPTSDFVVPALLEAKVSVIHHHYFMLPIILLLLFIDHDE
jgi:hypothetical protein